MSIRRCLSYACVFVLLGSSTVSAQSASLPPVSGFFQPFMHLVVLPFIEFLTIPEVAPPVPPLAPVPLCMIDPLPPIEDAAAIALEEKAGTEPVVNVDGLTPVTARALSDFEMAVRSLGGTFEIHSAHRPQPYQDHLRAVWEKWILELRDNHEERCGALRAEVEAEFLRHDLLESQSPAVSSDHTRGTAFDAAVSLPRNARLGRRRVSVDTLARRFGITRPVRFSDPVHFRCFR